MRSPAKARLAQLNSAGFKFASLAVLTLASGRRFFYAIMVGAGG